MTDPRAAALAEALERVAMRPNGLSISTYAEHAAAILAALPEGWCGHAALLAEVEAGVEGLRIEGPRIGQRGFDGACAAVLDLIRKGDR